MKSNIFLPLALACVMLLIFSRFHPPRISWILTPADFSTSKTFSRLNERKKYEGRSAPVDADARAPLNSLSQFDPVCVDDATLAHFSGQSKNSSLSFLRASDPLSVLLRSNLLRIADKKLEDADSSTSYFRDRYFPRERSSHVAVVQCSTRLSQSAFGKAVEVNSLYCRKHGYDHIAVSSDLLRDDQVHEHLKTLLSEVLGAEKSSRFPLRFHPSFNKVVMAIVSFLLGYEYVLWLDDDAFVRDHAWKVEAWFDPQQSLTTWYAGTVLSESNLPWPPDFNFSDARIGNARPLINPLRNNALLDRRTFSKCQHLPIEFAVAYVSRPSRPVLCAGVWMARRSPFMLLFLLSWISLDFYRQHRPTSLQGDQNWLNQVFLASPLLQRRTLALDSNVFAGYGPYSLAYSFSARGTAPWVQHFFYPHKKWLPVALKDWKEKQTSSSDVETANTPLLTKQTDLVVQSAITAPPNTGQAGTLVFERYESSPWEEEWLALLPTLDTSSRHWTKGCSKLREQQAQVDVWLDGWRRWSQSNQTSDLDEGVFSFLLFRESISGRLVKAYLEPLVGLLRHPSSLCGARSAGNKDYMLTAWRHQLSLTRESNVIFMDLGASLWKQGIGGASLSWFWSSYSHQGLKPDRMICFEAKVHPPATLFNGIPPEARWRMQYFNVPVSTIPGHPDYPWDYLVHHAKAVDYVIVKLDIDSPSIEAILVNALVKNSTISSLVDEFFFEEHVRSPMQRNGWGEKVMDKDVGESAQLFVSLRKLGIRAHSWI